MYSIISQEHVGTAVTCLTLIWDVPSANPGWGPGIVIKGILVAFLSTYGQMLEWFLRIDHCIFLICLSLFISHNHSDISHSVVHSHKSWCLIKWSNQSATKKCRAPLIPDVVTRWIRVVSFMLWIPSIQLGVLQRHDVKRRIPSEDTAG